MSNVLHPATEQGMRRLSERLPHALLITGARGIGKRTIAEAVAAQALGIPVERIASHPFLTVVEPIDGTLSIDMIRDLQHELSRRNASGNSQRIAFIIDGHAMGEEAQNALLKTLEEPPAGTHLIMTAASPSSLLPTIRSRMQELAVSPPSQQQLEVYFTTQGFPAEAIARAYRLTGGLPGLMSALLIEDGAHPLFAATVEARELLQADVYGRLLRVDALSKKRQLCQDTCFVLQQMAGLALQTDRPVSQQKGWHRIMQAAYDASQALSTNAGPKLTMTNLMLSL